VQDSVPNKYIVNVNRRIIKDISRIPEEIATRILVRIKRLGENPFPSGCKKLSNLENGYRLRQGDYRVLYVVNYSLAEVTIVAISHRKDAYRNI
jgi:mRNA interferase RelE/StbE